MVRGTGLALASSRTPLIMRADRSTPLATLAQREAFGTLLRDRRNAAGLSRAALGRRCKLSEAMIKLVESASRAPTRKTLIRLVGVTELGLSWDDVALLGGDAPLSGSSPSSEETALRLNCLVAPRCDPVRLEAELRRLLHGAGGHVDQWAAYHDPRSALAYVATSHQGLSGALRDGYPIPRLADCITRHAGDSALRIIALGIGAGALELRLAQQIQSETDARDLELCLIDLSAPLLCAALDAATDALSSFPMRCWGVLAGFAHLPQLTHAYAETGSTPRRRVFVLLGETLADLEHESRFFAHQMQGAQPGDLLVVDFLHAVTPSERDPLLLFVPSALQQEWLLGIGRRYWPSQARADLALVLEPYPLLRSSYAVTARARLWLDKQRYKDFSLYRFKRYEPAAVVEALRVCGWELLTSIPIEAGRYRASALLLRKREEPTK